MHKFNKSSSMNHKNGFDHHRINNNHPIHIINKCNSENDIIKEIYEHDLLRKCRKITDHLPSIVDIEIETLPLPTIEEIESITLEPLVELEQLYSEPIIEIQQVYEKNKTIIESITEKEKAMYSKALKMWKRPKKIIV